MSHDSTAGDQSGMSRPAFWQMLKRIAVIAGSVDVIYLVVFALLGMPIVAALNIVSAGAYALAYVLLGRRKNLAAVVLMWAEVLLHSSICTYMFGWDTGIHYFLLVFLPAVAVSRKPRHAVIALALLLLIYLGLDVLTQVLPAPYPLSPQITTALRWLNVSVVFLMFGYTGRYYVDRVAVAERGLQRSATVDELTGLWNRRHFIAMAGPELERARRYGKPLCAVMADIDHFKAVNDTHGHAAGDAVIREVAASLRAGLRTNDMVARWGGEEFIMLLPHTDCAGAVALCERVRARLHEGEHVFDGRRIAVTASFGVHSLDPALLLEESIKRADEALYAAKHAGRDRVVAA